MKVLTKAWHLTQETVDEGKIRLLLFRHAYHNWTKETRGMIATLHLKLCVLVGGYKQIEGAKLESNVSPKFTHKARLLMAAKLDDIIDLLICKHNNSWQVIANDLTYEPSAFTLLQMKDRCKCIF